MTDFYPGQKVVCIDNSPCDAKGCGQAVPLALNGVYTISGVEIALSHGKREQMVALTLVGVGKLLKHGNGYNSTRFRPFEEKASSVEGFRRIARDISNGNDTVILPDPHELEVLKKLVPAK